MTVTLGTHDSVRTHQFSVLEHREDRDEWSGLRALSHLGDRAGNDRG